MVSEEVRKERIKYKATFFNNCGIASVIASVAWVFGHIEQFQGSLHPVLILPAVIYFSMTFLFFDMSQRILGDL